MAGWQSGWARIRDRLQRSRVQREIDEELRFHLDEEIEAGVRRGLSVEAARRAAHDSLGGNPLLMRERVQDVRRLSRVDDLRRDLRHGVRLLRRSRGFAAVILATLAVAIGTAVTAFSIADAWLFRPLAFPGADRLVVAFMATSDRPAEPAVWMPYRAYVSWKSSVRSFASLSAAFFQGATWRSATDARSLV